MVYCVCVRVRTSDVSCSCSGTCKHPPHLWQQESTKTLLVSAPSTYSVNTQEGMAAGLVASQTVGKIAAMGLLGGILILEAKWYCEKVKFPTPH